MGRPRKNPIEVEKTPDSGDMIKVLSSRPGDIQLPGGVTLKYQGIAELPVAMVEYLEKSFKGEIRRI